MGNLGGYRDELSKVPNNKVCRYFHPWGLLPINLVPNIPTVDCYLRCFLLVTVKERVHIQQ